MIAVLWVGAVIAAAPCDFAVPGRDLAAELTTSDRGRLVVRREYPRLWAQCALDRGAPAPVLTVRVKDGGGERVLSSEPVKLRPGLDPEGVGSVREDFVPCAEPAGKRLRGAVLHGPAGRQRWHHPTRVSVELKGEGPAAAIAWRSAAEVLCPVCPDGPTASTSFYRLTGRGPQLDNQLRFTVRVDPARLACAGDAGALHVRFFWGQPGRDELEPLAPFGGIDHLERKLRVRGDHAEYEEIFAPARFCRPAHRLVWELVGTGELAYLANSRSYGPSRYIRRDGIEFQKCP